jgi:hypothetical protein
MVECIKEIGLWVNLMGMEYLLGQTIKSIKGNMYMARKREKALSLGQMGRFIVEDGIKANNTEKAK